MAISSTVTYSTKSRKWAHPRFAQNTDFGAKGACAKSARKPKIRFYFEESNGSLTPVYGNRKFPSGPPVGFVQTTDNHHGPAPQHPVFLRTKH